MPTDRDLRDELTNAVDILIRHRVEEITQGEGDKARKAYVLAPALLKQLRNAIVSTVGAHPNSGTLPSQRNVLDSDAYETYTRISAAIVKLYGERTAAVPFNTPEQNLAIWHDKTVVDYSHGRISDSNIIQYVVLVENWVRQIDDKLNPPHTIELLSPCPYCKEEWVISRVGRARALQVVYRLGINGDISSTYGHCLGCAKRWNGKTEVAQLGRLLDESTKNTVD